MDNLSETSKRKEERKEIVDSEKEISETESDVSSESGDSEEEEKLKKRKMRYR